MPANEDDLMTVGELARRVGVTVRTIQYYDQKGLLHPSSKSEQNQRLYSRDDEERLYRILTLKYLGFSLAQIKEAEALDDRQELSGALEHRMHGSSARASRSCVTSAPSTASESSSLQASTCAGATLPRPSATCRTARTCCGWPSTARAATSSVPEAHPRGGQPLAPAHGRHNRGHARRRAARRRSAAGRLALRFERLGGMSGALAGLKRLANQRAQGPKQYDRDFYAGIQRRTLSFLKDALEALRG